MVNWKNVFPAPNVSRQRHHARAQRGARGDARILASGTAGGVRTSIDLNYRVKLWSRRSGPLDERVHALCDVLITRGGHERVFGIKGKDYRTCRPAGEALRPEDRAITLRENPLVWKNSWTAMAYQDARCTRRALTRSRLSIDLGGRLLRAGLIHGLLENDLQRAGLGNRRQCAEALDPGDFAWLTREESRRLSKLAGCASAGEGCGVKLISRDQVRELDAGPLRSSACRASCSWKTPARHGGGAAAAGRDRPRGRVLRQGQQRGDGFVIARHLDNHGIAVRVLYFGKPEELTATLRSTSRSCGGPGCR